MNEDTQKSLEDDVLIITEAMQELGRYCSFVIRNVIQSDVYKIIAQMVDDDITKLPKGKRYKPSRYRY